MYGCDSAEKKLLKLGALGSAFIDLQKDKTYSGVGELIHDFGWEKIMNSLFNENLNSSSFENSALFKSYISLVHSDNVENEEFEVIYKVAMREIVYLLQSGYCVWVNFFI